jgi:hypothetical protein
MGKYAKTIVAVIAAAAIAAQLAIEDGSITGAEWWTIVLAGLGAAGVYRIPNRQTPPEPPVD